MIEIITPEIMDLYQDEIEDMHRLRCRVFRERLHWEVTVKDGMERDKFDNVGPVYLLNCNSDGAVEGTWRLLPTTGPYMLRDVFRELLEARPAPNDPHIWETSRFAVESGLDGSEGLSATSQITRELFCGLVEFCLTEGIVEILTVYDIRIARLLGRIGSQPKWQSGRHRVCGTVAVAGHFDINERVLEDLRAAAGITESVLRSRPRQAA